MAIILMEKEVKHYMKNKDNKKRRNMKKEKQKQINILYYIDQMKDLQEII